MHERLWKKGLRGRASLCWWQAGGLVVVVCGVVYVVLQVEEFSGER